MTLITPDDFVGSIKLAQLGDTIVAAGLQGYIDRLEPGFLSIVIGTAFAGIVKDSANDNIRRILTIRAYLSYSEARYVYWHYVRDMNATSTPSGKATMKQENATKVSPVDAQVVAWNELVRNLREMYTVLSDATVYPEFILSICKPLYVQNSFGL